MTLVPAMAEKVDSIVMLQRSPSYLISWPARDRIANLLRKILPDNWAYAITRWKNTRMQQRLYRLTRTRPEKIKDSLLRQVRSELGPDYDVDKHFTPAYNPWDQRLCLVPDGDFFQSMRSGKASVVTDRIDHFTESGIALESGEHLEADIIVTATGLELLSLGNVSFSVDGEAVDFSKRWTYRGVMYSDVPNLANTFGYVNASWTLRADLIADYLCRLLNHMDSTDTRLVTPRLREQDSDMTPRPWIDVFSSGYLARKLHLFPKQGDHAPWTYPQDYLLEKGIFRKGSLEDGVLRFERTGPA